MDKVAGLRKTFLDKHYASDKNYYDSRDISRVKSDDEFVHQFLAARDGNVGKAHKLMVEAMKWRKEFGINDVTEKDVPEELYASGYLYTYGQDKNGACLVFTTVKRFVKGDKAKLLAYKKLFAFTFEKIQREHPGGRLCLINNVKDGNLSHVDNDLNKFITFLQTTAYPDILENAYLLHLPKVLEGIWKIFKGLLGSRLNKKYILSTVEELSDKYIDKDQLPLEFGGNTFEYKYPPDEKVDKNSNESAAAEVTS